MLKGIRSVVSTIPRRATLLDGGHRYYTGRSAKWSANKDKIIAGTREEESPTQPPEEETLPEQQSKTVGRPKIDRSRVPVLNEDDLDEKFISGGGPGGQKVNKAVNCCQLRHRPTGFVIKVHQMRSLDMNRKMARELLIEKLDNHYNGELSVDSQKRKLALHRISTREAQSAWRRELKEQFKRNILQSSEEDSPSIVETNEVTKL